ncbi:MAG: AI-2E family transporter [Flavobacteriales bacterium]|nr:AI-2E family transporter [Flavobacteriales bacterium]
MPDKAANGQRQVIQPQYHKLSMIMLGLVAFFYALSITQSIVVPLLFALLLAMLLNPLVNLLARGINRVVAIGIVVMVAMLALVGLGYFIVSQAAHFAETLPELKQRLIEMGADAGKWAQQAFNMKRGEVNDAVEKMKDQGMAQGGSFVGKTLTTVGSLFGFFFLLPVFTFLLLLYKRLLIAFITALFPLKNQEVLSDVLAQAKGVVQRYLVGLLFEAGIVTALNWAGLMIIGVEYALLLAVIGALLNLIPYIGMIIATTLPMVIALATLGPSAALWVLALYVFIQFLDNNFIVPKVVASRVELNALVSIIVVMIGGALWGIPGMFLAVPLTAMLKVIFDRVPGLEPFGLVLADEDSEARRAIFRLKALEKLRAARH